MFKTLLPDILELIWLINAKGISCACSWWAKALLDVESWVTPMLHDGGEHHVCWWQHITPQWLVGQSRAGLPSPRTESSTQPGAWRRLFLEQLRINGTSRSCNQCKKVTDSVTQKWSICKRRINQEMELHGRIRVINGLPCFSILTETVLYWDTILRKKNNLSGPTAPTAKSKHSSGQIITPDSMNPPFSASICFDGLAVIVRMFPLSIIYAHVSCVCVSVEAGNGGEAGEKLNWQRWSALLIWDDDSTVNDVTHNMGARVSLCHVHTPIAHSNTANVEHFIVNFSKMFTIQRKSGNVVSLLSWKKKIFGWVTFLKLWLLCFMFRVLFKFSQNCPCYTALSGFQSIFPIFASVCRWVWSVLGCCF